MTRLHHLALADAWADAQASGRCERSTVDRSLAEEGFIHCSFADQVQGTADARAVPLGDDGRLDVAATLEA